MSLTSVANCQNLPLALFTPVASLPPVSLTAVANNGNSIRLLTAPVELVAKFAAVVVFTGGKFAAGAVDTSGNFCHRCRRYQWCTLTCEYLRQFLKKNRNDPSVIFRGLGDDAL